MYCQMAVRVHDVSSKHLLIVVVGIVKPKKYCARIWLFICIESGSVSSVALGQASGVVADIHASWQHHPFFYGRIGGAARAIDNF